MVKIKLGYRSFKMRSRYTVDDWLRLIKMDLENPKNWPKIMSIGFDQPEWKFQSVQEDSLILGASLIVREMGNRKPCKLKDFTQFKLGEFIDLDVYMVMGIDKNIDAILELICVSKPKWIDEALWAIDQYANFRNSTYRQYSGLFDLNKNGEQEGVDPEDWNPMQVAKGWYKVIVDLADNKLLDLDEITEQPLKKALNFMAHRKEEILKENFKQLQQKRQYDLQRARR